ncbi:MAG: hypothetical protein E6Q97_09340 [Desulfurellales bacterium]|nr:MAG: hypothetical protein E6Q97_09340 [Desulfurellales bacterium]
MPVLQLADTTNDSKTYNVDGGDTSSLLKVGRDSIQPDLFHAMVRFENVLGDSANTVSAATLSLTASGENLNGADQIKIRVQGVYTGNVTALPADVTAFNALSFTTAFVEFTITDSNVGSPIALDVAAVVNEIFGHISWGMGNAVAFRILTVDSDTTDAAIVSFTDTDSTYPNLDYTVPTAGTTGSVVATLGPVTLSATGELRNTGSAARTLDDVVVSSTGVNTCLGTLSQTLADVSLSRTGILQATGSAALSLDALSLSATGELQNTASAAITLDDATLASDSTIANSGTVAAALANVTADGAGTTTIEADVSVTLSDVTAEIVGGAAVFGSVSSTFDELLLYVSGDVLHEGTLSSTLDACECEAAGGNESFGVLFGSIAGAFEDVVVEAETTLGNALSVNAVLGDTVSEAFGGEAPFGFLQATFAAALSDLTLSATTEYANAGAVDVRLQAMSAEANEGYPNPRIAYSTNWRRFAGSSCVPFKREDPSTAVSGPCSSNIVPVPIEFVAPYELPVRVAKQLSPAVFRISLSREHIDDVELTVTATEVATSIDGVRPAVDTEDFETVSDDLTILTGDTFVDFEVVIIDNVLTTDACAFRITVAVNTKNVCSPESIGDVFTFVVVIEPEMSGVVSIELQPLLCAAAE